MVGQYLDMVIHMPSKKVERLQSQLTVFGLTTPEAKTDPWFLAQPLPKARLLLTGVAD
jgi:hypothetical protein